MREDKGWRGNGGDKRARRVKAGRKKEGWWEKDKVKEKPSRTV